MSYECEISFKVLKEGELYSFFQLLKEKTIINMKAIAEDNSCFLPTNRYPSMSKLPDYVQNDINIDWARRAFTHRFFFLPEHNLLGVFGVHESLKKLFDCSVFFQNHCDTDYEYETWNGVPLFEQLAEKWKSIPAEAILEQCEEYLDWRTEEEKAQKIEYWRKTLLYEEIWKMCEEYLWEDKKAVCISLFVNSEYSFLKSFVITCQKYNSV